MKKVMEYCYEPEMEEVIMQVEIENSANIVILSLNHIMHSFQ